MALGSTQPQLATYYDPVPLSRNLGTLTSWKHLGPSGPVITFNFLCHLYEESYRKRGEVFYLKTPSFSKCVRGRWKEHACGADLNDNEGNKLNTRERN